MGFKIVVGDNTEYAKRLEEAFRHWDQNEYELTCLEKKENILAHISLHNADVVVVSPKLGINNIKVMEDIPVFYLTEQPGTGNKDEIFCYQQISDLFADIRKKYYESSSDMNTQMDTYFNSVDTVSHMPLDFLPQAGEKIVFTSMKGGCGVTTAAMAAALYIAQTGNRVIYLDLSFPGCYEGFGEKCGGQEILQIQGFMTQSASMLEKTFSENLIEGEEGIFRLPFMDVTGRSQLTVEQTKNFIEMLGGKNLCDYLIIDLAMGSDKVAEAAWNCADQIVLVCDGSSESIQKYEAGMYLVGKWREEKEKLQKEWILYNRFRKNGSEVPEQGWEILGGIMLENNNPGIEKMAHKISRMTVFEKLVI